MSSASEVIARAQQFVTEKQPYTYGGKNQAMNKGNKSIVQGLKKQYGSGNGHYGHILGNDKTETGINYKQYVNAASSKYLFIDCSGLTNVAFKAGGIDIGHGSTIQNDNGYKLTKNRFNPKTNPGAVNPGALLHKNGHVAVMGYDNKVIEAKGWYYGCVSGRTPLSKFTSAYNIADGDANTPAKEEKVDTSNVIGKATIVNITSYLNVRPVAGTEKGPIGKLYNGNQVDVIGESGDWYQIVYNGKSAYISKKYASMSTASEPAKKEEVKQDNNQPAQTKTMYVTANSLNVRADANASSSKLGALSKGTAVTVLESKNGWHKIAYKQSSGWICGDYTSENKPKASGNIATAYEDYQKYLSNGLGGVKKDTSLKSYNNEEQAALNLIKAKIGKIDEIASKANLPRELVAGIWYREMSLQDGKYLHNGDPLGKATVHVPAGIYFGTHQFVEAAVHALGMKQGLADQMGISASSKDYAAMCAYSEAYNGFGYRNHGTASAYVAAGTDKYTGGLYVADGKFSSTKKDSRVGVLRIFMMMAENFPR